MTISVLTVLLLGIGCSEIFEKDISKDQIGINAPQSNDTLPSSTVLFWWDEVEGATGYHFQIVEGSFDNPVSLEFDSIATNNVQNIFLETGVYQWRVRGQNASSSTPYAIRDLVIDSLLDLSNEQLVLVSPDNNTCQSDTVFNFGWIDLGIPNTSYEFEIRQGAFENEAAVFSTTTDSNGIGVVIDSNLEGQLSWGVRVFDDNGHSAYSYRDVFFDVSAPASVVLTSPKEADTLSSGDVDFLWEVATETGCSEFDSLYVFDDSSGTSVFQKYLLDSDVGSQTVNLAAGDYSWKVVRYDAAGNKSSNASLISFIVE